MTFFIHGYVLQCICYVGDYNEEGTFNRIKEKNIRVI